MSFISSPRISDARRRRTNARMIAMFACTVVEPHKTRDRMAARCVVNFLISKLKDKIMREPIPVLAHGLQQRPGLYAITSTISTKNLRRSPDTDDLHAYPPERACHSCTGLSWERREGLAAVFNMIDRTDSEMSPEPAVRLKTEIPSGETTGADPEISGPMLEVHAPHEPIHTWQNWSWQRSSAARVVHSGIE